MKSTTDIKKLGATWLKNWTETDDDAFFRIYQSVMAAMFGKNDDGMVEEKSAKAFDCEGPITTHRDKSFSMNELREKFGIPNEYI